MPRMHSCSIRQVSSGNVTTYDICRQSVSGKFFPAIGGAILDFVHNLLGRGVVMLAEVRFKKKQASYRIGAAGSKRIMENVEQTTSGKWSSEISDHLLLDRYLANRSPEFFLELVSRHYGLVFGTCLRITRNPQDAEELTQECFFDLVRHASHIRTSLAGWLHQVATNLAINRLRDERRRKTREREVGLQRDALAAEQHSAEATWNEIEPLVDQALMEIPEPLRTPILMHYLEGVTQVEIASALGVHQSTVSRRLLDGLDFLRARLRRAGVVVSATLIIACFESQAAVAAPISLPATFGKFSLAGVGTAQAGGLGHMAWLAGASKGLVTILLLPIAAGIIWGEVVFLLLLAAAGCYLGLCRPEWFRVVCFTRQYPNVYEWPFFPFKRWRWQSPPGEWRLWMAASTILGIELLILSIVSPVSLGLRPGGLLLRCFGLWLIFTGIRIGICVRGCRPNSAEHVPERATYVDGVLLLAYASGCTVLFTKLCVLPLFLSPFSVLDGMFWQIILWIIVFSTFLTFGTVLVLRRFKQWRHQRLIDPHYHQWITNLAPPRWLLTAMFLIPLTIAAFFTYATLIRDVYPVYVPFGADLSIVARRELLGISLAAMDFVVLAILPLSYLYRRIHNIAWGIGFGVLGLLSLFHLGFFTKNLVVAPSLSVPPVYGRAPLMEVLPDHFVFSIPQLQEINSGAERSEYMAKVLLAHLRFASAATIQLEYGDSSASLDIPCDAPERMAAIGVFVIVQVAAKDFQEGIPTRLNVSLAISDRINRQNQHKGIELDTPNPLTPDEWRSESVLIGAIAERSFAYGESVDLGTVQGSPVILTVRSKP